MKNDSKKFFSEVEEYNMPKLLTVTELAKYLRVNKRTIYRLLEKGNIPSAKIGHQWRFDREAINDWIRELSTSSRIQKRATILVIDDEDMIIELFKETLKGRGYSLKSAGNGLDGLRLVKELDVDVVFLDLKVPGMNGVEIFRRIKDKKPNLPVIIMTGYPDSDLMAQVLTQGPFAVMNKPFTGKDITTAVGSFLKANYRTQEEELSHS